MIGVLSLQNRSIFIGDGGDNVIHLMATYLVLTRCGRSGHWTLGVRHARVHVRGTGRTEVSRWFFRVRVPVRVCRSTGWGPFCGGCSASPWRP
ncbi:hypothetical protein SALBM135S_01811 [Streptomyces alboniger]